MAPKTLAQAAFAGSAILGSGEVIQHLAQRADGSVVAPDLQTIFNQQQDAHQPAASDTRH